MTYFKYFSTLFSLSVSLILFLDSIKQEIVLREPRYSGIIQEACASAGIKAAELFEMVLMAVITHKPSGSVPGGPKPAAVSVGGEVTVATVIESAQEILGRIKVPVALMESGGAAQGGKKAPPPESTTVKSAKSDAQSKCDAPKSAEAQQKQARETEPAAVGVKKSVSEGVTQRADGVIAVADIHKFFKNVPFGRQLARICQPTKKFYQGQKMYKVTEKIPGTPIKKGDIFYLDAQHKNHLEVFDAQGDIITVLNLDGTVNTVKEKVAKAQARKIKL